MKCNQMLTVLPIALLTASVFCFSVSAAAKSEPIDAGQMEQKCLSNGWNKPALMQLKINGFELTDANEKQLLAMQLLYCLANPDSEIRDDIAFGAISQWLRAGSFTQDIYLAMFEQLTQALSTQVLDKHAVYQPFAALVYADVLRVDRISPYLNNEQRQRAIDTIVQYFLGIDDYRGFETNIGWRHGVAHSADVMLQLALNKAINKAQLSQMLSALKQQIVPDSAHFYIYGEAKRIAMAVVYIMLRNEHSIDEWQHWLTEVSAATPFKQWTNVYKNQQGLAKLHNTQQFLYALYALIKASSNERLQAMVPALEQVMKDVG